jgi:ssDNA-binding replication factor A large subunit
MSKDESVEAITTIANLTEGSGHVNVSFKVMEVNEPRRVTSRRTGRIYLVEDMTVADESAKIQMTLWNEDVDTLKIGENYELRNGRLEVYDFSMRLTKGLNGEITKLDHNIDSPNIEIDMSRPFMGRKPRPRRRRTAARTLQGTSGRVLRGYGSGKEL